MYSSQSPVCPPADCPLCCACLSLSERVVLLAVQIWRPLLHWMCLVLPIHHSFLCT